MKKNKGFTLVELLVVIVLLTILILFVAPNILKSLKDAKVGLFRSQINSLLKSAENEFQLDKVTRQKTYYYETGSLLVDLTEGVEYCVRINNNGTINSIVVVDNNNKLKGTGTNEKDISIVSINQEESVTCQISSGSNSKYVDSFLAGADPKISGDLIPVILSSTEEDWTVKYADINKQWYNYAESKWANAVLLVDSASDSYVVGDTIDHEDIEAYFVWIPKYKYKLFNMGNYSGISTKEVSANRLIDIIFGTENTVDSKTSCKTPAVSGESGNCAVGKWMTHPAFLAFDSDGFWVGKFETTGTISDEAITSISVLPGVDPLRSIKLYEMFSKALTYNTSLKSHMLKNTEWGAVAYLSHSIYGMGNKNIYINNFNDGGVFKTGCVGGGPFASATDSCTYEWYTLNGFNGSTSGNITGIYGMSGGVGEYVAGYRDTSDTYLNYSGFSKEILNSISTEYLDIYNNSSSMTSYNKRILGDATGEMGPFRSGSLLYKGSWYDDAAAFVASSSPWFCRGGHIATFSGLFSYNFNQGTSNVNNGFRMALTP